MKKIVFINQASGYLTVDIVNAFANSNQYSEIALITSWVRIQENELHPQVKTTKTFLHSRKSNFHRILRWMLATVHIFILINTKYRNYEVFYFSLPPMSYWCSLFGVRKFSVLIYDVYPDVLSTFGVKSSNFVYKLWKWVNLKVFAKAHKIFTLSEGMVRQLEPYCKNSKPISISNWSGFTQIKRITKDENIFLHQHVKNPKFIVQYSGNVSASHNTDFILKVAESVKKEKEILFQIIGRGNFFETLKNMAKEKGLENIQFLPFQDDKILYHVFSASDLSMVLVGKEVANISVPSKLYNLQSVGTPILGIAPANSELNKHIKTYGNGACFDMENLDEIASFIRGLQQDKKLHNSLVEQSIKTAQKFTFKLADQYYIEHNSSI